MECKMKISIALPELSVVLCKRFYIKGTQFVRLIIRCGCAPRGTFPLNDFENLCRHFASIRPSIKK